MAKRRTKSPPKPPHKSGGKSEHQDPRTGRFLPGNKANPAGRPKGSGSGLKALLAAAEEQGVDLLAHAMARALKNDAVLMKILDKLVPSAKSIEIRDGTIGQRKVIFERDDDDNDTRAE